MTLQRLPEALLLHISRQLDLKSYISLHGVCRFIRGVLNQQPEAMDQLLDRPKPDDRHGLDLHLLGWMRPYPAQLRRLLGEQDFTSMHLREAT